jgi:prepilin-type processing-associated H-X9-DG protein
LAGAKNDQQRIALAVNVKMTLVFDRHRNRAAFTRNELLVMLGMVLLLAAVVLACIQYAKRKNIETICAHNLDGLAQAFQSYTRQDDLYPAAARLGLRQSDDWIYWQTQTRIFSNSAIAPFLPGFSAKILRCPADEKCRLRPYQFSYTMNIHFDRLASTRVQAPAKTLMLFEEVNPNDGCCAVGSQADTLTTRHRGKGHVAFADGHVQLTTQAFASDSLNASP